MFTLILVSSALVLALVAIVVVVLAAHSIGNELAAVVHMINNVDAIL